MVDKKGNCGHPSKSITLHGQKTEIDEDIASIINGFKKLDIRTMQCYQENDTSMTEITFGINTIVKTDVIQRDTVLHHVQDILR